MDISDAVSGATSTPPQAAANIGNATAMSISPSNDKSVNDQIAPQVDQLMKPTEASPAVHEYMSQSSEHAALALGAEPGKPGVSDVPVHSFMDETTKYIGDIIYNRPTDNAKMQSLYNKKMDGGGELNDEDTAALWQLTQDNRANQTMGPENAPPSYPVQFGKAVGTSLLEMGRTLRKNAKLIAAYTGTGAATGLLGGPFAEVTVPGGAAAGFGLGVTTAFATDAYDSTRGSVYGLLDSLSDENGQPLKIDETTKRNTAYGAGLVGAALMGVKGDIISKAIPILNPKITPALAKMAMQAPESAAMRIALQRIGHTIVTMGGVGAIAEASNIFAENFGKHFDGTPGSVMDALTASADSLDNWAKVGQAAAVNATTGLVIAGVGQATGMGTTRKQVEAISQQAHDFVRNVKVTRNNPAGELVGDVPPMEHGERPIDPRPTPKDVTPIRPENSVDKSIKVLRFEDAMNDITAASQQTKMNDHSPAEMSSMMRRVFDRAGIGKVYSTFDSLRQWATSDEKGEKARNLIDPSGVLAGQQNAPFEIDPVKVAELAKDDPTIWSHVSLEPDGPTGIQAKTHLEQVQAAMEKRAELMKSLGIEPKDIQPKPESNVIPIGSKPKGEAIPFDIEEHVRHADEILNKIKSPFPRILEGPDGFMGSIPKAEKLPSIEHKTSGGIDITLSGGGKEQPMEGSTGRELKVLWPSVFAKDAEGNIIGSLSVKPEGDGHVAAYVEVDSKHQGKGVASALYQYANANIAKIKPSQFRTEEGKKFAENFDYTKLDEKSKKMVGVDKLEAELADIKGKITEHLKGNQPGDLLIPQFGQWPEPTADTSNKLASNYINEPTFTEAIEKAIPKAEVQQFNIAQQNARKAVVDNIKDTAIYEMEKVQDVMAEMARDERLEIERQRIANDPNYAIVDKVVAARTAARASKEPSVYAVDPRTLTKEQLKYVDNFRLKERGLFDKNGKTADQVAELMMLTDGNELLEILSKTPTREQVIRARSEANRLADETEARESVDLNHTRIVEALTAETTNHIAEMKFMREQEWPATKKGIKRIALPLPKIEELTHRAKVTIEQTRVGSLSPNQYRSGERKSNRLAINSILKNEVSQAFIAKESAALNSELVKETYIATAKVNRALTFMRKLNKPTNRQVLRQGGKASVNAMAELTSLFNFKQTKTPTLPVGIEAGPIGDYLKWATAEVKAGRGDFSIPERLTEIRQSYKDMTVEQLLVVTDRARVIFNEAKLKGQLIRDEVNAQDADADWNIDRVAEKIVELSKAHPGFTPGNLKPVQGERRGWAKLWYNLATPEELLAGKQNIIRELDQGRTGGFFHKVLDEAFEGSGKYYEKSGFTYLKKVNKWIDGNIEAINKAHGSVNSLEGKFLNIPELRGIPELNNGELTKADLLAAMANRGQQYTKDMLLENNGGVSDAIWQQIFDRELEPKDVQHMQSIVDLYKHPVIREKTVELQKRDGRDVDFIEGIPFVHRGKTYDGGYIRVRTVHNYTQADVERAKELMEGKGAAHFEKDEGAQWGRQYGAETTKQGYLVSRTSNKEPIALSYSGIFDGLREIAHDHAYREPLRNFFTVMDHPDVMPAIIQAVGEKKANTLIGTALEIAGRPSAKEGGYFSNPNRTIKSWINNIGGKFASSVIWGNMSATIRQLESMPEVFNLLGPKGIVHFAHVNWTYLTNLDKVHGFIESAVQLDPNLQKYIDGVNDNTASIIDDLVPKKGRKIQKSLVGQGYEFTKTAGFLPHQAADAYLKAVFAHSIYKYVMNGDHPSYSKDAIAAMTEQEQFETAQSIVQQMSALTQIQNREELKAPIQKNLAMKPYTYFWNYPRNVINNTIIDARRTRWKSNEGWENINERNWKEAGKDFAGAANIALSRIVWNTIGGAIATAAAGGTFFTLKKIHDWSNMKEVEEAGMAMLGQMMEANFERTITTIPIASSIHYALTKRMKYSMAQVQDPHGQALSSIATCIPAIENMLSLARHPNRMQMRACLEAESYVFVALPVRGYLKATQWMDMHNLGLSNTSVDIPSNFKANFNTAQVDKFQKNLKEFSNDPGNAPKELVAQADALHKQLAPDVATVPHDASDTIKFAVSGGQWSKPDGLFGFKSSDWKEIMRSAPELGLTENGRIAKDTTQQEKAMDWSLHNNASQLAEKDIPVNTSTLYGTHILGVTNYEKVFNAPADAKVKTVLGADALKDHAELANFKTIGQVKAFFSKSVEHGKEALESDKTLTSKTSKNED